MEFVIYVGDGDYCLAGTGADWGRADKYEATTFGSREEATSYGRRVLAEHGFRVEELNGKATSGGYR